MNKWFALTVGVAAGVLVSPLVVSAHAGTSGCSFAALEARAALHDYRVVVRDVHAAGEGLAMSAARNGGVPSRAGVARFRVVLDRSESRVGALAGEYGGLRGDLVLCGGTTLP